MSAETLFHAHLPLIERVIASICRRHGCRDEEAEEFAASVRLKLIEDDYGILRKFEGKSSLATYLTTVVHNLFRDFRIARWGKWRPCAAARQLGTLAVALDRLLHRDGFSFEEAAEILRTNHQIPLAVTELADLAAQLPPRAPRRFEGEETLEQVAVEGQVEEGLADREKEALARRIEAVLGRTLRELPAEDRLILRMHFEEGLTLARIARALRLEQKPLYRRRDRLFETLRAALAAAGVDFEEARHLLGWAKLEIRVDYEQPVPLQEFTGPRPSPPEEGVS